MAIDRTHLIVIMTMQVYTGMNPGMNIPSYDIVNNILATYQYRVVFASSELYAFKTCRSSRTLRNAGTYYWTYNIFSTRTCKFNPVDPRTQRMQARGPTVFAHDIYTCKFDSFYPIW
jgi:hypothetical protein